LSREKGNNWGIISMKKVLIALFIALVLFCATGGLERFASDDKTQEPRVTEEIDSVENL
jgi:hypothetical protein